MDNIINTQNSYYSKMKKILITIFLLMLSLISINAVEQKHIIDYEFESTAGTIVFDNSGNNLDSLLINGASFVTTQPLWDTRVLFCDGVNDYTSTFNLFNLSDVITISIWFRPSTTGTLDHLYSISSANELIQLEYDGNLSNLQLMYYNSSGNITITVLENYVVPTTSYTNVIIILDRINERFTYYRGGIIKLMNIPFNNGYNKSNELKNLLLCTTNIIETNPYYAGRIDAFKIFNFKLNSTQLTDLYNINYVTFAIETPIINETSINLTNIKTNLINNTIPLNNDIVTKFDNIQVQLNTPSFCELYLDSNLIYTTTQRVYSFTYPLSETSINSHSYLAYCYYTENNIKYYDITNYTNFNLTAPIKTINFNIYDINNQFITNQDLYLSTPCPDSRELSKYWNLERPFYVQKLVNGYANYDLNYNNNYEFCLLKGKINYDVNTYTQNVNFVDVTKVTSLGILYVTNETLNYNLKISNEDLYKASQPEFWGKTWSSLFTLIVSLILGGLLIFIGVRVESKILIYIGGVIIAGGLGISISNIIWGSLF